MPFARTEGLKAKPNTSSLKRYLSSRWKEVMVAQVTCLFAHLIPRFRVDAPRQALALAVLDPALAVLSTSTDQETRYQLAVEFR
jgi:hypothetical protein